MRAYERLLQYVKIDTSSDPKTQTHPSTTSQLEFGKMLIEEMRLIGIKNIKTNDYGYIYGEIPKNTDKDIPTVGFIAHMDTSFDMSGKNIKPKIVRNYDGKNIVLNQEENIIMKTDEFSFLPLFKGRDLIVTDGTTLLGADNKAGIAEILTAAEEIIKDKDFIHGDIKIAFTPDEEIGEGALFFDVEGFNADFAYTVDGGPEGYINYENFNAASCEVIIHGKNIHPGSAKNKMINSILIAQEFQSMLPTFLNPAFTENYEGFNHLNEMNGNVEKTTMHYIIRNHDISLFNEQKKSFTEIADFLNNKYKDKIVYTNIKDSYFNMYEHVKNHMYIVDIAIEATKMADVNVVIEPIRGGTDGAVLTYKGLICPNIGTGGFNFHGRYEAITIQGMDKSTEIIKNIVKIVSEK